MIKPSIGRVVWCYRAGVSHESQPCPALIAFVHSDTMINIGGFDNNGQPFAETSCLLHNDPESYGNPGGGAWCKWMPYQQGQAAKAEALEKQIAEKANP